MNGRALPEGDSKSLVTRPPYITGSLHSYAVILVAWEERYVCFFLPPAVNKFGHMFLIFPGLLSFGEQNLGLPTGRTKKKKKNVCCPFEASKEIGLEFSTIRGGL